MNAKFLKETLPDIVNKIDMILDNQSNPRHYPVDCVAFDSSFTSEDGSHYNSVCYHPERGTQFGCLLVKEDQDGRIQRVKGSSCDFRVKNDKKGASSLRKSIDLQNDIKF